MKSRLLFVLVFLLLTVALSAQVVDRDEFTDILGKTINFVNFTGTHDRIDTLDQINEIGRSLGRQIVKTKDSNGAYGDRYRVLHVLGTAAEPGKAADIIIFTEKSGIDHIDNVRRIVSSYLMTAYGYTKPDADILALFVTIYNAVHRGNMDVFTKRYKASVVLNLSSDKVGLSLKYTEWPGRTQLVIPLGFGAASSGKDSTLTAVAPNELITPAVIETVRDKPGTGTAERQQLANLMDRTVDQEQNAIDRQKALLAAEEEKNRQRQAELDKQLAASKTPSPTPVTSPVATATPVVTSVATTTPSTNSNTDATAVPQPTATPIVATTTPSPTAAPPTDDKNALKLLEEQAALAARQLQIEAEKAALALREKQNNDLAQASQDLRATTATDLKTQGDEAGKTTVLHVVVKTRLENGMILGQVERINTDGSDIRQESSINSLIGRHLIAWGDVHLGLEWDGTVAHLILLSDKDLSLEKRGTNVISPYSELVEIVGSNQCLAVVQVDGDWYLGRFDRQLNILARSAIPVDPVGALLIKDKIIFIQRKDGRMSSLNIEDLRITQ